MYENNSAFPEEISGIALGFEQKDAVVEIKSPDENGKLRTEMYIFYAYDDSILHVYAGEESKVRGYVYNEISQDKLYEKLGLKDGILSESLRWLAQTASDAFSKKHDSDSLDNVHQREIIFVGQSNAEKVSILLQNMYDGAEFSDKERFAELVSAKVGNATTRLTSEIDLLFQRLTNRTIANNLANVPINGADLIVEPSVSFFDTLSKFNEVKESAQNKIAADETPSPEALNNLDYLSIVEKVANRAGLQEKVVSAKVGGWLSVYSPVIDEVVLYDASVMNRESGFALYENFSKESFSRKIKEGIYKIQKRITDGKAFPLGKIDLINLDLNKKQVEKMEKQNAAEQLNSLQRIVIEFGRDLAAELAKIDGSSNGELDIIISEYEEMSPEQKAIDGERFFQSIIMTERGVKFGTTKQITTPHIVKNSARPSISGGLPRWVVSEIKPIEAKLQAMPTKFRLPTEENFIQVSFRKQIDITNKGPNTPGVKGGMAYVLDSIIGKENVLFFPVTRTLAEKLASSIQLLDQANENGLYISRRAEAEGRGSSLVNLHGGIEYIGNVLREYKGTEKAKGKDEMLDALFNIFAAAKTAMEQATMSGEVQNVAVANGMKVIKKELFCSAIPDVRTFVEASLAVKVDSVESAASRYFVSRNVKKELNDFATDMRNAIFKDNGDDLKYISLDKNQYVNDDQYKKALKTLSWLQFSIAKQVAMGLDAFSVLKNKGEAEIISSKKTPTEGVSLIGYSPEIREAFSTLYVLRNQEHMANVSSIKNNYIWHNTNSKYTVYNAPRPLRQEFLPKVTTIEGGISSIMNEISRKYFDRHVGERATQLLENGLAKNRLFNSSRQDTLSLLVQLDEIDATDIIPDAHEVATEVNNNNTKIERENTTTEAPTDNDHAAVKESVKEEISSNDKDATSEEVVKAPEDNMSQSFMKFDDDCEAAEEEVDEEIDFSDLSVFIQENSGAFDDIPFELNNTKREDNDDIIFSGLSR
jgi:hypothetical protein